MSGDSESHGTVRGYQRGCRCDECRAAKRSYLREWHLRKVASGEVPHGTTGYRYGCRCDTCSAAHRDFTSEYRPRHRELQARARDLDRDGYNEQARTRRTRRHASPLPEGVQHGEAAYVNYGCRCPACTIAARDSSRRLQRERQAATVATASRNGYRWTGAELELVVTRTDLSVVELARLLGRTAFAVRDARTRATRDPKWMKAAGVDG